MQSNGCTYGAELDCGRHGARETMEAHHRPGSTVHRTKYHGAMRKGASWRQEHKAVELATLDAIRSQPVKYTGPGYKVRRCSR